MTSIFERPGVKVDALAPGRRLDLPAVRVDESGFWLDGVLALPRADIRAVRVALHERTTVHLQKDKSTGYSCTFTDPNEANALLEALGRTPERTTLEVALEPSLLAPGFNPLPVWKAIVAVSLAMVALVVLLPFLMRAGAMRGAGRFSGLLGRTLVVGADGIGIRSGIANEFLAYCAIASVASRDSTVVLTMRDGRECVMTLSVGTRVRDVVRRIERAIAEATVPADDEVATLLHDVAGTTAEKVSALRELGSETQERYREGRPPRERLWAILEDPQRSGATRTRAAIALSGTLADEDRTRLRIATDATVSPKVRVAMETVIQNNDPTNLFDDLPTEDAPEPTPARRPR